MRGIVVRLATGGLLASFLLACTPLTEQQIYDREVRLIEAREEYFAKEASCTHMGGSMQVRTRSLGRADYLDYKAARCVRR